MKKLLIIGAAVAALTATAPAASAQSWMSINQRQAQLDQRIDVGVRNGSLTRSEALRLRGEFNDLARLEARYRVNGLSAYERRDLDMRFDRLSAQINYQRHDNDNRGWTNINARQRELEARINQGVREGSLTLREASGLRAEFNSIARLEARYRVGGLSVRERFDLQQRFNVLDNRITAERNDWQTRRYRG